MGGMGLRQAIGDGGFEGLEVIVVFAIEALLFDKLPQALNEVQIGRIAREEEKFDIQRRRQRHDDLTSLITRVVKDDGDGDGKASAGDAVKQIANAVGVNVGIVGDQDEFMRDGVKSPQHIEALTPRGRAQEQTRETP